MTAVDPRSFLYRGELDPDPSVTNFVTNTGVFPIPASAPARGLMIGAGTANSLVTVTTSFP
ncbi:MAG: hypothetical protein ABIT69_08280, partial [Sphingomicrobium sp.]